MEEIENATLKFGRRGFDGVFVAGPGYFPEFFRTDCGIEKIPEVTNDTECCFSAIEHLFIRDFDVEMNSNAPVGLKTGRCRKAAAGLRSKGAATTAIDGGGFAGYFRGTNAEQSSYHLQARGCARGLSASHTLYTLSVKNAV